MKAKLIFAVLVLTAFCVHAQQRLTASVGGNINDTYNGGIYIGVGSYGLQNAYVGYQAEVQYARYNTDVLDLDYIIGTFAFRFPVRKFSFIHGIQVGYQLNSIPNEDNIDTWRGRLAVTNGLGYFILKKWELSGRLNIPVSNKRYDFDIQLGVNFHI